MAMLNSKTNSAPFIPPPPPPPPPPSAPPLGIALKKQGDESKGQVTERPPECFSSDEQGRKAFQNLQLQGELPQLAGKQSMILSCYSPVKPVLQNGPVCGLVALSMASQLSNENYTTTDDIFSEAQKRGFSKQGEMFSVSYMKELAYNFLHCQVENLYISSHELSEQFELKDVVKHLLLRNVLLVPYDADRNHSPCQKRGHKAHWALITGFIVAFPDSDNFPECVRSACRVDSEIPSLLHWPDNPPLSLCEDLTSALSSVILQAEESSSCSRQCRLYVYGHQGKSKHAGVWSLGELLQSNAQLEEAGPERGIEDYVIPQEGVVGGLKSQILIVKRRNLD